MRMRALKNRNEILEDCDFYYSKENTFENKNEVHLEVGMGKGDFIIGMAKAYPNINFIGMEKYSSVACVAIKKIKEENLTNVKVLVMDVADSVDLLKKSVNKIYLNFSDPWPKDRHAKRRLTHKNQLKIYDELFIGKNEIIMKTDNDDLFNYSVESFKDYGYKIIELIKDLHSTDKFNVVTEYETKFGNKGFTIKYVHIEK